MGYRFKIFIKKHNQSETYGHRASVQSSANTLGEEFHEFRMFLPAIVSGSVKHMFTATERVIESA